MEAASFDFYKQEGGAWMQIVRLGQAYVRCELWLKYRVEGSRSNPEIHPTHFHMQQQDLGYVDFCLCIDMPQECVARNSLSPHCLFHRQRKEAIKKGPPSVGNPVPDEKSVLLCYGAIPAHFSGDF